MDKRKPIYCSCHGNVVMGYCEDGQITWFRQEHGKRHFKALPLRDERAMYAKAGRPSIDNGGETGLG